MESLKCWGKKLVKWGLIGLVLLIGIKMIAGKSSKGGEVKPATSIATTDSAQAADLSQRREELISEEVNVPAGQNWVTISFPCYKVEKGIMWYQTALSPTMEIELDFLDGQPHLKNKPGEKLPVKAIPAVIRVRATGNGGKVMITLNRQFLPDSPKPEVKKVSSSKKKKVRTSHKGLADADMPHSPQIV